MIFSQTDIQAVFGLPPDKVIAHLQAKGLHISWNWQDTLEEAHSRSFTIAKMTEMSLLSDTRKAITQALKNGEGHRGFKQTIKPEMQSKGWWGKQTIIHEHGMEETVQLGSPRRLRTIWHTNIRTAVAAARYTQQLEAVATHPYWQYWAIMDGRTRPSHSAMHGVVYRYDDPFWQHSYPPNGFNCRCQVRAINDTTAGEWGGVQTSQSDSFTQETINKQTGEVYQHTRNRTEIPPKGNIASYGKHRFASFAPEAGFNASPAASHLLDQMWLERAIEAVGNERGLQLIAQDMAAEPRVKGFLAWVRNTQNMGYSQHRSYGIGVLSAKAIKQFQTALSAEKMGSPVVAFQDRLISGKKVRRHAEAGDALDMAAFEKIIRDFGRPDYELWDTKNGHLLLVYKMKNGKAVKLSVMMYPNGAEIISGFYQKIDTIEGAIKGEVFKVLD